MDESHWVKVRFSLLCYFLDYRTQYSSRNNDKRGLNTLIESNSRPTINCAFYTPLDFTSTLRTLRKSENVASRSTLRPQEAKYSKGQFWRYKRRDPWNGWGLDRESARDTSAPETYHSGPSHSSYTSVTIDVPGRRYPDLGPDLPYTTPCEVQGSQRRERIRRGRCDGGTTQRNSPFSCEVPEKKRKKVSCCYLSSEDTGSPTPKEGWLFVRSLGRHRGRPTGG